MSYLSSIKYIFTAFISIGIVALYTLTTQAVETNCGQYTSSTPPPAGYGAAYNVFSPQMLVQIFCDTGGIRLQAGAGETNQVVYEKGYYYRNNVWSEIRLSGATRYEGASSPWFVGSAQSILSKSSVLPFGTNYIVAYVCVDQGGQWKCGCSDSSCVQSKWQLQAFTSPPECTSNSDCEQEIGKNIKCNVYGSCSDTCGTPGTNKRGCSCPNVGLRTNCDSNTICGDNHLCI